MSGTRIAVLGAGNGGYAMSADLTLAGYQVNLYEIPRFKENLEPVLREGGIELSGVGRNGFAKIRIATSEIAEAISEVDIILVTTQGWAHETLADLCAPNLEDGQTIILFPGWLSTPIFARRLLERKVRKNIRIAETNTFPYGCRRLVGQAKARIFRIRRRAHIAAFPARDTQTVLRRVEELYPNRFSVGRNVLEVGLSNPNIYLHVPMAILNYRTIEMSKGEFYPFRDGGSPAVVALIEAMGREKGAILKALRLRDLFPIELIKEMLVKPSAESFGLRWQDRFLTEDCPLGMVMFASLGDLIGIPSPITKALISLISEIRKTDYFEEGRTVERLGISGMSIKDVSRFFREGGGQSEKAIAR